MKHAITSKPNKGAFGRLWWYLLLVIVLSAFCYLTLDVWLLPYSIAYSETGNMTAGYFLYAAIGLLFSTPTPFIAVLIISLFIEKTGFRQMLRGIFRTENKLKTVLITGGFCLLAFVYAISFGTPNGSPWYMFPLGFLIMIPFVGIAEETGWRGLLQPELDKRMPYPFSVLLTAAIWFVWHFPVFIDPTSNHYGDSIIGFGITIFIWAFALAAIYRSTKSVIACALYHTFMDAIGAVYDWNALFDGFPGSASTNVFRGIWLIAAVVVWLAAEKKEREAVSGKTSCLQPGRSSPGNLKQVFESSRISFVEVSETLVKDYLTMVNDYENVNRLIGGRQKTFTEEQEREWVREKLQEKAIVFSMIEKKSGAFIGNIELMHGNDAVGELGIAITAAKQNAGFGTEAVSAISEYGTRSLGLKRIILRTNPQNSRAIHVYHKCGFIEYDRTDEHIYMEWNGSVSFVDRFRSEHFS